MKKKGSATAKKIYRLTELDCSGKVGRKLSSPPLPLKESEMSLSRNVRMHEADSQIWQSGEREILRGGGGRREKRIFESELWREVDWEETKAVVR